MYLLLAWKELESDWTDGHTPTRSPYNFVAPIAFTYAALVFGRHLGLNVAEQSALYPIPERLTLGRFPNQSGSDSRWRTMEVRHGGIASRRFRRNAAARFGEADQGWPAGAASFSSGGDLRRCNAHRGGEDWRCWASDHPGLGVAIQHAGAGRPFERQGSRATVQTQ